jgi:glutathione S-transferase
MGLIYHIAYPADWHRAQREGGYRVSTRGRTLDEQGFIHASTASQVATVANAVYGEDDDLVVLVIDEERVGAAVVYEAVPGSDELYPHIYGPLNVDAVVGTRPLARSAGGGYTFPVSRP